MCTNNPRRLFELSEEVLQQLGKFSDELLEKELKRRELDRCEQALREARTPPEFWHMP